MSMINWAVRKKMIVLQLVAYLNFFGGFGIWGMTGHQAWFLAGVAVVLAAAVGLGLIRCPRCHNFAYRRTTRLAGVLTAAVNSTIVAGENLTVGSTVWLPAEGLAPGR
jgi:hypothetical protein